MRQNSTIRIERQVCHPLYHQSHALHTRGEASPRAAIGSPIRRSPLCGRSLAAPATPQAHPTSPNHARSAGVSSPLAKSITPATPQAHPPSPNHARNAGVSSPLAQSRPQRGRLFPPRPITPAARASLPPSPNP